MKNDNNSIRKNETFVSCCYWAKNAQLPFTKLNLDEQKLYLSTGRKY